MDATYFLKRRTTFIRSFYDTAGKPFADTKHAIENELSPFDDPPYSEEGEPPFLNEWLDADAGTKVLGLTCVSLLSDSLKLYFKTLQDHVIWFKYKDPKSAHKNGFLAANLAALGHILQTDWSDCSAATDVIEQVVLARNRAQHGEHLAALHVNHDAHALDKYPNPFFANDLELKSQLNDGERPSRFLTTAIEVTREKLFAALLEVEKLAEFIDSRLDRSDAWRRNGRPPV